MSNISDLELTTHHQLTEPHSKLWSVLTKSSASIKRDKTQN